MQTIKNVVKKLGSDDYRHIVNISGGKDSAALAIYLKQTYPQLPSEHIFCDTGCELPETYEYLDRLEALLGVKIIRLSALELLGVNVNKKLEERLHMAGMIILLGLILLITMNDVSNMFIRK